MNHADQDPTTAHQNTTSTSATQTTRSAVWSFPPTQVLADLGVLPTGLTDDQAQARLAEHGRNQLTTQEGHTPLEIIVSQFCDVMIGLLAGAALISAIIGEWEDAALIAIIVVANGIIGFVQEWRAEKAVAALKKLSQPRARVWRNGAIGETPVAELVPGDIIELLAGNLVPADARLLESVELQIDEAPLTGESLPVEKSVEAVAAECSLPDRLCMVHSGTAVMLGHGRAVVTATGMQTELGKVAAMLHQSGSRQTPLQARLSRLSRQLAIAVISIATLLFLIGVIREPVERWNRELLSTLLLTAVSLAVAAIPEGLPAVITVALALGSQRMSNRRAIIRQLPAVETLGSVNVICSDKTGTLTQNRMQVVDLLSTGDSAAADQDLLRLAVLCSNASVDATGTIRGSATEAAIFTRALKSGLEIRQLTEAWPRLDEQPFNSSRKRMATLHRRPDGSRVIIVKGAAEQVLALCDSNDELTEIREQVTRLAERGHRMLAVASCDSFDDDFVEETFHHRLKLCGLIGIVDPVRLEAAGAIQQCRDAGIKTIMITGDHPGTARAIAEELTLWQPGDEVMTGLELDQLSDEQLFERAPRVTVYARVAPEHKLRIVRAHQAHRSVVAMTGDGVNDAPALKQSDIGVAMGITGTDVARESSAMILADDNFTTIVAAVEEGRVVFDNIRKFVAYLLTGNIAEVLVLLLAMLSGIPLPLLPIHILWINLVTDGLPAIALGFEAAEPNVMARKPRQRDSGLFDEGLGFRVALFASIISLACLGVFLWTGYATEEELSRAQTMVFMSLSFAQLMFVMSIRAGRCSVFKVSLLKNVWLLASVLTGVTLQLVILYVPAVAAIFKTVPLTGTELLLAGVAAAIGFTAAEVEKLIPRRS